MKAVTSKREMMRGTTKCSVREKTSTTTKSEINVMEENSASKIVKFSDTEDPLDERDVLHINLVEYDVKDPIGEQDSLSVNPTKKDVEHLFSERDLLHVNLVELLGGQSQLNQSLLSNTEKAKEFEAKKLDKIEKTEKIDT
ncbi:uncharacterized protein HKW66_Vig0147620 [Vigna angularis]|uniref:Uncharacterized protein n=1 Tax=Phaseolus angularis TaxID=3914 RepID=A0A8T0JVB1_PHAAN|nr:uncharacterized protein HKW66_Vig0147620 [Vigna angularis]